MSKCRGCGEEEGTYEGLKLEHSLRRCLANHLRRIEAIESKLGAASPRESATREDAGASTGLAKLSQAATPNVSAEDWYELAAEYSGSPYRPKAARACDLAAAITRIYESTQHLAYDYDSARMKDFTRVCLAFVRGEPLPEKNG